MPARSLSLRNVTKFYGRHRAVEDVSLYVEAGEFISFLGPSGSGKTTTLMMVAGFEAPTAGRILIGGEAVEAVPAFRRNLGMVFQNYALFPHMTVTANISFPLRMRGLSRADIQTRTDRAMATVGLGDFGERYPIELSGGQQQRVALARALVFEPDLVLLDEPLGALDKNFREQMQVELKRIHRQLGVTMVYVTHDQSEAMTMSDRVVVFNDGRIEQIDRPLRLYREPRSAFVASFIGENNVLAGRVKAPGLVEAAGFGDIAVGHTGLTANAPVHVMLRPERIRLSPPHQQGGAAAREFVVNTVMNYGDSALVIGTVHQTAIRVRVSGAESEGLAEGAVRWITWDSGDVHVMLVNGEQT
jgi:putative spermidine/putrescine transport system ATP-binding protein